VRRRSSKPPPAGRARTGRTSESAYEAGVRLLARRAHSRAELRRKLARRGYDDEDVAGAMRRLGELGYLDDAAFAAGHVRRRSASLGPLALSAELAARGVDRRVAGGALATFDHEAQLAAATRLAARLSGRNRPAGYRELLDSVGAKLLRRGFPETVAREACRTIWRGTAGTSDP
jgi:regulatory protein